MRSKPLRGFSGIIGYNPFCHVSIKVLYYPNPRLSRSVVTQRVTHRRNKFEEKNPLPQLGLALSSYLQKI